MSYIRSGDWLNKHCPKANGPMDADDFPNGQELDCIALRRWARLEYKRPREAMRVGQGAHLFALHEMVGTGWEVLEVILWDEGQSDDGAGVHFSWSSSRGVWVPPRDWPEHRTTLGALGQSVTDWVWHRGPRPGFAVPPPPACAECGVLLPHSPQQTISRDGHLVWVCVECFQDWMARVKAARVAEAQVGIGTEEQARVGMERLI